MVVKEFECFVTSGAGPLGDVLAQEMVLRSGEMSQHRCGWLLCGSTGRAGQ